MSKTTEHKEGRATVDVIYYKSKKLADGAHPFMVCITKDRQRKYIATGLSLLPKYWQESKKGGNPKVSHGYPEPHREQLIKKMEEWRLKYKAAADELAATGEPHTADEVASKAIETKKTVRRVKVIAYIEELAVTMTNSGQVGNASVYRDLKNQLAKFIKDQYATDDLFFERITVAFCNEWEATLRASGVEEITLSLRFRTLRAVLNKAIANGVAKAEHYPFSRNVAEQHKFSVGKFDVSTTKRAISRDDVRKLEAFTPTTDRQRLAKDVFLFSFYCGGINFVDLAQLRWSDLTAVDAAGQTIRLNYVRQKTGGKLSMKLLPPPVAIVASYRPLTHAGPTSYLFPVLDPAKHQTPTQIKNRLHKVLGQVNHDLKGIAELVGITTTLTTYVARHSFATSLKHSGVATGVISEMMGHQSEAVTAVYLGSFASETVDAAYEQLL